MAIPRASHRDITVIGASAGGITALRKLLAALPADYPAAIFVVVHVAPESPSLLHELLSRAGRLPAIRARDATPIVPGRIVVAPPEDLDALGKRVPLTCPECGGSLWELQRDTLRFRCHMGHAYSAQTLASDPSVRVEAALWAALRILEENERLAKRLAEVAAQRGIAQSCSFHEESARTSAAHADVLRRPLATARPIAASDRG